MRYSETHKAETHAKLVKLAGRALREKGPGGLAVAELMKAAGLTHGGFYAHFKSKDALLLEALDSAFAESEQKLRRITQDEAPRRALARFIDAYVSPAHRDRVAAGCPIVALNSDLPRQSRRFRAAFDAGVSTLVGNLTVWITTAGVAGGRTLAASMLSTMAGAVALSRAMSDKQLSDQLLAAVRLSVKATLGLRDNPNTDGKS
jgi:TetR/AcrR family transcriptional regulator, transcriptional repressor for nem operon